jgi:prophage regulatory protein
MQFAMDTKKRTLLKLPQVRKRVPLSRATIYAMAAEGRFPRPIKLGGHASFWIEEEIDSWLEEQIEQQRKSTSGCDVSGHIDQPQKAA